MRESITMKARHIVFAGVLTLALALGLTVAGMAAPAANETESSWGIESAYAAKYKITKKTLSITAGDSNNIWITNQTAKQGKSVKWSSSNTRVAKVKNTKAESGLYYCKITAVSAGTCTVKGLSSGKTYKCKVTVKPLTYTTDTPSVTVKTGETATISVTYSGAGSISFGSYDKSVAEVAWIREWSGNTTSATIKGLEPGTTTVKFSNNRTSDCFFVNVTVLPAITVQLPNLPVSVRDGSSSNQWRITIESVSYKIEKRYLGGYNVIVDLKATKRAVIGSGKGSAEVCYKVYDEDGIVVSSGNIFKPNVAAGETYKVTETIYIDEEAGNFRIEFFDHDAWL